MTDWSSYVARYHEERPGVSEDLLASAVDGDGRSPYDWLVEAVPDVAPVVDVACGSGPVLRRLRAAGRRAVGVDRAAAELGCTRRHDPGASLVRADAISLPLATGSAAAVTVSLALMVVTPLEGVLGEIVRVLRPGGVLVATVPVRSGSPEAGAGFFAQILADLGQAGSPYPSTVDLTDLRTAGLDVRADGHRTFVRTVAGEEEAEAVVRSFYAPGATAEHLDRAAARLRRRLAGGRIAVPFTIRRIVAASRNSR